MDEIEYDGIEEIIEIFTFRNEGSIKIPKVVREVAFTLQIDVEIVSVSTPQYVNFKSSPPNGFYGYATIVRRDYCNLIIPIEQGRQNLYYERQDSAHQMWYQLYLRLLQRQTELFLLNERLVQIGTSTGVELSEASISCPSKPVWQELPISSIFIRCPIGTQFKIEVAYFKAKPIEIGGCSYDGKSGIIDGDKDLGLPERVLPRESPVQTNPFQDLPFPSSQTELGEFANFLPGNLDDRKTLNDIGGLLNRPATQEQEGYYWEVSWLTQTSGSLICIPVRARLYKSATAETSFRIDSSTPSGNDICVGSTIVQWRIINAGTETTFFDRGGSFVTSGTVNAFFNYGILPTVDEGILLG